ncbi:MAG: hypothetical protein LBQ62_02935 [Candidatus Accumulibacter sp.]|jgi:hypothetical protein|nr:hypothetical protein [Accumulibacter sp.]
MKIHPMARAAYIFYINEIRPLMARMEEVNAWAGQPVAAFREYDIAEKKDDGRPVKGRVSNPPAATVKPAPAARANIGEAKF